MIESLHNSIFYEKPEVVSSAPGILNLMGEHTHHSMGFVFSIAINHRAYVSISSRADEKFVVYSDRNLALEIFTKRSLDKIDKDEWITPVKALIKALVELDYDLPGLNICIASDIPQSPNLADIPASVVALSFGIRHLQNLEIENIELFHLCERVGKYLTSSYENIFDYMASALARGNTGILIDCKTFQYEYAPISKRLKILIIDPVKKNELATPEILKRKDECKNALDVISTFDPQVKSLRDLTIDKLNKYSNFIDKISMRRIKYIVEENERALNFVIALRRHNLSLLGKLMFDSHLSLRNDYEISTSEIDAIVDTSATIDGVIGAKLFGAGSGVVAIAIKEKAGEAIRIISEEFQKSFGRKPKIYVTSPENGVEVSSR